MKRSEMSALIREQARVIAYNLRDMRSEQDLSRVELAERSGVSESSIYNYEYMRVQPSAVNVVLLARALGCTTDHLLGVDEERGWK